MSNTKANARPATPSQSVSGSGPAKRQTDVNGKDAVSTAGLV